ncbi:50S ribosomal protein L19 [Morus notabilis]|uniref:50S ribosomal protein L19 n=1 Tax=Morus notabilis TaxID=981085 RepID=W9QFN8_9ROSA|nr:50S ribosomal protein L19 [Morus notabilis]
MARALKPREVVRTYAAHLKRSGQELFYRSNSSDAGLSSSAANSFSAVKSVGNSVGSSRGFFLSKLSNRSPAAFIMDKEAVEEAKAQREIPDIRPGYIVQLKVFFTHEQEVPENKRRVSIMKGIVIARRNAGLNTTFRIRRLVAGVGVESLFPLYSPNIKEIKVLDKKKVRRAKLYYLRDKMNALKRQ